MKKDYSNISERAEETPAEEVEFIDNVTTAYHHTTAERIATIAHTIAGAVGACFGSSLPVSDMAIDVNRFNKWCEGSSVADADASAPFWFAVRKQGSESGTRENCKARCRALGSPLYVLKVEREAAGLFSLTVRVSTRETAEEITAATIKRAEAREEAKEAESTADDAQAADALADIAERLEAETRRFEAVRRIAARRRALLIRMTTGGRGKTAEAWKFARVTLSAYGEKVVTVWAVGMTETIYTRTYRVKADGSRYEVRHNYTTENTAAAANWLRSIHRAALLNGWGLTIETATAAEVKEADPAARLSSFIPGADRLADTFERLADLRAAERMTPAEVAAPAADLTADSEADTITPGAAVVPAAVDACVGIC